MGFISFNENYYARDCRRPYDDMNGWFTVERIDAQTFAISEYRHWEETHCYLLCGQDKSALIDTGLGVSNIQCVVDRLTTLPVTVLTTHLMFETPRPVSISAALFWPQSR